MLFREAFFKVFWVSVVSMMNVHTKFKYPALFIVNCENTSNRFADNFAETRNIQVICSNYK